MSQTKTDHAPARGSHTLARGACTALRRPLHGVAKDRAGAADGLGHSGVASAPGLQLGPGLRSSKSLGLLQ